MSKWKTEIIQRGGKTMLLMQLFRTAHSYRHLNTVVPTKKIHICDHNLNYHPPSLYQSFDEFRDLIRMLACCSPL